MLIAVSGCSSKQQLLVFSNDYDNSLITNGSIEQLREKLSSASYRLTAVNGAPDYHPVVHYRAEHSLTFRWHPLEATDLKQHPADPLRLKSPWQGLLVYVSEDSTPLYIDRADLHYMGEKAGISLIKLPAFDSMIPVSLPHKP